MPRFVALFDPSDDGLYSVVFPDLPGCDAIGRNLEEAASNARDALRCHLSRGTATIPRQRPVEELIEDAAVLEALEEGAVLVPVYLD